MVQVGFPMGSLAFSHNPEKCGWIGDTGYEWLCECTSVYMCVCLTSCPLFLGLAPDSKQDEELIEDELLNNYYTNKEQIGNHIYFQ